MRDVMKKYPDFLDKLLSNIILNSFYRLQSNILSKRCRRPFHFWKHSWLRILRNVLEVDFRFNTFDGSPLFVLNEFPNFFLF